VLYSESRSASNWEGANLVVTPLSGGPPKVVVRGGYFGRYVPGGYLLYMNQGTLFAVRFDLDRLEALGQPLPALDGVSGSVSTGGVQMALSAEGTFAYVPGAATATVNPIEWLTRDGKTLIVDDTLGPTVYAYDVQPDGSVKNKRTFTQLRDIPEGKESGADGMALDREDRLYVTTVAGVQVFDAAGKYLGTIKVPRQPANAAFAGPDKRVLYITAREGLYRINMLAQGPDRIGK